MDKIIREESEVLSEIETLEGMKDKVRHYSMFGDDNRKAIEVAIQVLKEKLPREEIEKRWLDNDYIYSAAQEAYEWLTEEDGDKPSIEWSSLVQ